jgi:hypothetical protein
MRGVAALEGAEGMVLVAVALTPTATTPKGPPVPGPVC